MRKAGTILAAVCTSSAVGAADVVVVRDKAEWIALIDEFDTIDFTGFPEGTLITNQYADRGLLFTDRHDFILHEESLFPNDGEGLDGGFVKWLMEVHIDFRADQFWFAIEYANAGVEIDLYRDDELLFHLQSPAAPGSGSFFFGVILDEPFDEAHLGGGFVLIDDLHFGPPICVADLDGDDMVGFGDLVLILSAWGEKGGPEDLDANGVVDFDDLLLALGLWGPCE